MYQRQVFLMGKHNWSLFSIWSLLFSKFSIIWRYYFNDQKQEFLLEVFIVSWTFYFLKRKVKLSKVQTLHLSTSTRTKVTQENLEESQWELRVNILQRMDTQGDQHHWKRRRRIHLLILSCCHREHYSVSAVRMS